MIWALNTGIGNKRKPWPDLVGGACRARIFVLGFNIIVGLVWLSSHTRPLVFL